MITYDNLCIVIGGEVKLADGIELERSTRFGSP